MVVQSSPAHSPSPEGRDILGRLKALTGRRVLVIGDLMLDRYIWGDVSRISPSAPVPIVRQRRTTEMLGGSANVARNLAAAGAKAELIGVLGDDAGGRAIKTMFRGMKIGSSGVLLDPNRPSIVKTSILSKGQQLLRLDIEDSSALTDAQEGRLVDAVKRLGARAEVIVLSDYLKGVVTPPVIGAAIGVAKQTGIPVVVDTKSTDFKRFRGADFLTPNIMEASAAAGEPISGDADIERVGRRLLRRYQGKGLVITRSGEGFSLVTLKRHFHQPALAQEVFDETGCGDTMIAHFALALAARWDVESALFLANKAAAITIGKIGAAVVSPEELAAALGAASQMNKVRNPEGLAILFEHLRDQGRRIVFTNGCFDLIHVGHIRHLHEAGRLGDVLIVALNTDRSVRRIKGPPRPVLGQAERASVLSALDVVDYITFFDEDSPERLLKQLRPDVLVKGKHRPGTKVVGADIVESYNGRVVELPVYDSSTTDALLRKIQEGIHEKP